MLFLTQSAYKQLVVAFCNDISIQPLNDNFLFVLCVHNAVARIKCLHIADKCIAIGIMT